MTQRKTLSASNQFCITCPIFKVETKLATCFQLRDLVWKGKRPEVRKGCQAAMMDSKCPADHIIKGMLREDNDPYHSDVPKLGSLDAALLNKIAPIQVMDRTMDRFGVSDRERALLIAANGMSADHKVSRTRKAEIRSSAHEELEDVPAPETAAKPDATVLAAQRGDMSAAINAALNVHTAIKNDPRNQTVVEPVEPESALVPPENPKTPSSPAAAAGKPLSLLERARLAKQQQSAA